MSSPAISNQNENDFRARAEELASLLDHAVPVMARQLLVKLSPKQRTATESQFLFDCCRSRREASRETLAMLLTLDARANSFTLADTVRAITVQHTPAPAPLSLADVALEAEEADVALDRARDLYLMEQTPVRASVVWECARQLYRKAGEVIDRAAQEMHWSASPSRRVG